MIYKQPIRQHIFNGRKNGHIGSGSVINWPSGSVIQIYRSDYLYRIPKKYLRIRNTASGVKQLSLIRVY
jgi:hypothetical protein